MRRIVKRLVVVDDSDGLLAVLADYPDLRRKVGQHLTIVEQVKMIPDGMLESVDDPEDLLLTIHRQMNHDLADSASLHFTTINFDDDEMRR